MAIDFRKYVNIISGVGAALQTAARQLLLRIFTTNPLVDINSVLEFSNADDVGTFFGTTSPEYLRAKFYFGWVSPLIRSPRKIQYARFANAATGAAVYGGTDPKALTTFTAITTGALSFLVDGVTIAVSTIDLSAAASLTAVATALQTAIQAAGAPLTAVTVTYDAVAGRFTLQDASAGTAQSITLGVPVTGTDLAPLLEWTQATGAVPVHHAAIQTPVQAITASVGISNNFGSFIMPDVTLLTDVLAVGQYNATNNVSYQYWVAVSKANYAAWSAALIAQCPGLGLAIQSPTGTLSDESPEIAYPTQIAATDYEQRNGTMGPMYKQFALTPSVTDTTESNAIDAARVNYYGVTQVNGQFLAFMQRGKLMGGATAPIDVTVFANEQWLKSDATAEFFNLQLGLGKISANDQGLSQLKGALQSTVTKALRNGTISVGKPLTTAQIALITQLSGNDLAYLQVNGKGYWFEFDLSTIVATDGSTEWIANYTLIYSKDDTIRSVNGSHVLI